MNAARDPLSEIEARLANGDYYVTDLEFTPVFEDFRTLINEVKELREKNADREEVIRRQVGWHTELEAEVKELREENERLDRENVHIETYRAKMEEALRSRGWKGDFPGTLGDDDPGTIQ